MSGDIGLGSVHEEGKSYYRDAVHIAVLPVVAADEIAPGTRICVDAEGNARLTLRADQANAVADCYLPRSAKIGERFYAMLFPGSITSLRHDWTHPAFPGEASTAKQEAEAHLTAFATKLGVTLDEVLWHAKDFLKNDEYWCEGWRFDGVGIPKGFWGWYQAYTGEVVPMDKQCGFFSCSC